MKNSCDPSTTTAEIQNGFQFINLYAMAAQSRDNLSRVISSQLQELKSV